MNDKTPEQSARELLERMGVEDARNFTPGNLVELSNLIHRADRMSSILWHLHQCGDFYRSAIELDSGDGLEIEQKIKIAIRGISIEDSE